MKTKLFFFLTASLTLIASSALRGEEPVPESSYVEQLRQTAKELEVFPVDLIAREGPLSCFEKGRGISKIRSDFITHINIT